MVSFYPPGSMSMSDYHCFEMQPEGTISIAAVKERFRLLTVNLLDGTEVIDEEGFVNVMPFLSVRGTLSVSGVPEPLCSDEEEEEEGEGEGEEGVGVEEL
mmetsp:Transcript_29864/g.60684  ORF Transcript_29864/g.60684 Transcript_29864/m.60684 type:complete len:100 (+) Transcript_29864:1-300(+)